MSMSTHVVGFKPADEKWKKMKTVWNACLDLPDVSVPEEVLKYFDYIQPGDKPGMEVDMGDSCKKWIDQCSSGYEIDIEKVPEGVKFIRVFNSF